MTTQMTSKTTKAPSKPSRKDILTAALSKRKAPTVTALSVALSVQPHSVRAAISGLRRAGHKVETIKSPSGGVATYRIVATQTGKQ